MPEPSKHTGTPWQRQCVPVRFVITCEHGGNKIPQEYRALFQGKQKILASHRGYDPGALELANKIARLLKAPKVLATTSRLLVDLNRSVYHRHLFSEVTKGLPRHEKARILKKHYFPHREKVASQIQKLGHGAPHGNCVIHLAIHSFTPILDGKNRDFDIGLLFDPRRKQENTFCQKWKQALLKQNPQLRIRFNAPYQGRSDGLTTAMRRDLPNRRYIGIELEMNQKFPRTNNASWHQFQSHVLDSLQEFITRK